MATSKDLLEIPNAAQPTPGQGLTLGLDGRLPLAVKQTLPGYEYAYNEYTGNVSVTATTEATANTVATATAVAFNGSTAIMVDFYAPVARPDSSLAGRTLSFWLYLDGASIGQIAQVTSPAAAVTDFVVRGGSRVTPASGSRTYSVRASVNAGTGTVFAGAGGLGAFTPGFIRITKA